MKASAEIQFFYRAAGKIASLVNTINANKSIAD